MAFYCDKKYICKSLEKYATKRKYIQGESTQIILLQRSMLHLTRKLKAYIMVFLQKWKTCWIYWEWRWVLQSQVISGSKDVAAAIKDIAQIVRITRVSHSVSAVLVHCPPLAHLHTCANTGNQAHRGSINT